MNTPKHIMPGNVLDRIVASKMEHLRDTRSVIPLPQIRSAAENGPPATDFLASLSTNCISLIAEMKRSSPSGGELMPDLDPASMARVYAKAGVAAISVLTEREFFHGSTNDIRDARSAAVIYGVPVLQKDFIFDEYQVYEARAAGADAVLLIASIIDSALLRSLLDLINELGMSALVEVFNEPELETVVETGSPIIGINNRDLNTLETSLCVFERLAPLVPKNKILVAESGMKNSDDVRRMINAGANAVLVGEALMRARGSVSQLVREITNTSQ